MLLPQRADEPTGVCRFELVKHIAGAYAGPSTRGRADWRLSGRCNALPGLAETGDERP